MATLPVWCVKFALPVDLVRRLIKRQPELRSLGERFGPTRLFTGAEFDEIRRAYAAHVAERVATAGA